MNARRARSIAAAATVAVLVPLASSGDTVRRRVVRAPAVNTAPDRAVLAGPSVVTVGSEATFSCSAADVDGGPLTIEADRDGDGSVDEAHEGVAPATVVTFRWSFAAVASHAVRCRARDGAGATGEWSAPLAVSAVATVAGVTLRHAGSTDVRARLDRPTGENVLKLFRAAADPEGNRIFVSGIMTRAIGVLDGASEAWTGTIDTGTAGNSHKYLAYDPGANRLYVRDGTNHELSVIDVAAGTTLATIPLPEWVGTVLPDPARGVVYLATGADPGVRTLDGATLASVGSSTAMGTAVTALALDGASGQLWALAAPRTGPSFIHRFDPVHLAVTASVALPLTPPQRPGGMAWDEANRRFFIAAGGRSVLVLSESGGTLREILLPADLELQDFLYDPDRDRLVTLLLDRPAAGAVCGVNGHLLAFDPATGVETASLAFGKKPHTLTRNPATGRIYAPNGDASVLWSIAPDCSSVTPLRLGDSLEQAVLGPAGTVVLTSRLGGSYLMTYDPGSGALATFTAGTWPIPLRSSPDGAELAVLNAWDSTVSLFAFAGSPVEVGRAPLGVAAGTTDRLPDLAVDWTARRAYAAYPELGAVAVADLDTMQPLGTLTVARFPTGDVGGGPGQLQVLPDGAGSLFVFWKDQRRLERYDATTLVRRSQAVLQQPADQAAQQAGMLTLDAAAGRLFVGPVEVDAATGAPTGRRLARGQRVIAVDAVRSLCWCDEVGAGEASAIVLVDRATLAERGALPLGTLDTIAPEYAVDLSRGRLWCARMTAALLEEYSVTL